MRKHQKYNIQKFALLLTFAFLIYYILNIYQSNTNDDDEIFLSREKTPSSESQTVLSTLTKSLKSKINCRNKNLSTEIYKSENFTFSKISSALQNISIATNRLLTLLNGDLTFLHNAVPLLTRWMAPISIAVYAPGNDFEVALKVIFYLRNCHEKSNLIQQFATFHFFFETSSKSDEDILHVYDRVRITSTRVNSEKFLHISQNETFKARSNLKYPINTARNLARNAATTHFILVSDIELYPNPDFINDFFEMLMRVGNEKLLHEKNVFVLPIFEIIKDQQLPISKSDVKILFKLNKLRWFHYEICRMCHKIPLSNSWLQDSSERMEIHTSVKRQGSYHHWEPLFVSTNGIPFFDEHLSWDGKSDKMTQIYVMCLLDYEFNVLSNGFLIHKSGIKTSQEAVRKDLEEMTRKIIIERILPEIFFLYGENKNCKMFS